MVAMAIIAAGCIENPWLTPTPSPTPTPPPVFDIPLAIPDINPAAAGRDNRGAIVPLTPGGKISIVTGAQGTMDVALPVALPRGATLASFSDPFTGVVLSNDGLIIPIRDIAGKLRMTLQATVRPLGGTGTSAEGRIEKLELETAAVSADLSDPRVDRVSFQVKTQLMSLPDGAALRIMLAKAPNPAAMNAFTLAATRMGNRLRDVAFVAEVTKTRLVDGRDIGPGTVTFQVGRRWADSYPPGNVAVAVLSDDGSVELLLTRFEGYTLEDTATFAAQTKRGVSTFGLVAMDNPSPTPTPTPSFYQLNASVYPPDYGRLSVDPPSPTGRYLEGSRVVLGASPGPGASFERWEGDVTGSQNRLEIVMDSNKTVSAVFRRLAFTLTAGVIPQSGGMIGIEPYLSEYEYGTRVTLTAQQEPGFVFRTWSGDLTGTANPITIVMDGPKSVTANFAVVRVSYSTSVNPARSGLIAPASGTADIGTQISLFATPTEGYVFSSWSGNVPAGSTDNPLNVRLDRDLNIVANFSRARFTLTTQTFPITAGSVSPSGGTFEYGQSVTLTAVANQDFLFNGWGGDISGSENPKTITITKNTRVDVNFLAQRYTLSVRINPPEGGFVSPITAGVFPSGTIVTLETQELPGYIFDSWSGDQISFSRFISVQMTRNVFLTANFRLRPTPPPPPPPTPTPTPPPGGPGG